MTRQEAPEGQPKNYQACCVRKDSVTVTAEEGREQYYINTSGSSALATAGSGDVLAGITGAFAAKRQCEKNREKNSALPKQRHWRHMRMEKAGEAAEEKMQCFLCNSIRDYQRIAVNLSKADQNHGFPKNSGRTFLKRRMKFVNTSGKTGNIKYMETILKGVKRRIVIVWESKTERIGE